MNLGFLGYESEVGRALLKAMIDNGDLQKSGLKVLFFSSHTPKIGSASPFGPEPIVNSNDLTRLSKCDVIINCQSDGRLKDTFSRIENIGWKGQCMDIGKMDADPSKFEKFRLNFNWICDQILAHGRHC